MITGIVSANSIPIPDPNTRLHELKQFDQSKIGVKGLVDRGITTIPSFFITPDSPKPITSSPIPKTQTHGTKHRIPIIDFSLPRTTLVEQLRQASSDLGFFQIINHSVPLASINKVLSSLREFYELPEDVKMQHYSRDPTNGVAYSTNFDLYRSKSASWRDTLQIRLGPTPPDWDYLPDICREAVEVWDLEVLKISEEVMNLLCEGLGLGSDGSSCDRLKELSCLGSRVLANHYYPYCPQPELTTGLPGHMDPGVLTVLVQNQLPGLQVKVGEEWVDVEPVEGAIVFNIGDILQMMSNDLYKSVEHRVVANTFHEARVSVAVFLSPSNEENLYGPFPEVVTPENPARYRQFTRQEFFEKFFAKELNSMSDYFRI